MKGKTRIITLKNGYHVWTRSVGNGPIKLLLLHGGPGMTHEYFENFSDYLPQEGVQLFYYDQLGSYYSDQPSDNRLWELDRFVDEVEEVRTALGLNHFYLLGNSWGGLLCIEYALKYGSHLKGVIISNMVASIASYVKYINHLRDQLPEDQVKKMKEYENAKDYDNEEYQAITKTLYERHICRKVPWPDAVQRSIDRCNNEVYNWFQGDNEFVVTGTFKDWNRWKDLHDIKTPTLLIVGRYDSMSAEDVIKMGELIPNAKVHICEKGSHMSMWDDPESYFPSLISFLKDLELNNSR